MILDLTMCVGEYVISGLGQKIEITELLGMSMRLDKNLVSLHQHRINQYSSYTTTELPHGSAGNRKLDNSEMLA